MTIPVGYAQINHFFDGNAAPTGAQVTFGVDIGAYAGDPDDLALLAGNAWAAEFMPVLSDQLHFFQTLVKFGPDATGPSAVRTVNVTGGDTGDTGHCGVCALIQKQTALGGKAGRGRMFVPGIPENQQEPGGLLVAGGISNLTTSIGDYTLTLTTNNVTPVVLHQPGSPLSTPTPVTGYSVSNRLATQRQRQRR